MQPSEEIKAKLDIVEFIREYIPVQAAGINFRAVCPFHREKSPSFMISPEKQIWHCFGCGKGGDIFSFLMEMEGIDFVEALRILAPKAGVTLKRQDPKFTSQRNRLLDILNLSRRYYHKVLLDTVQAKPARKYLKERGLNDETLEEWQIGYSRDSWDDLIIFLKSKGYNDKEIFLSGMSVQKSGQNRFFNRFRNRIMFPINDVNANTIGFSARVSPDKEAEERMGKYINSPQNMLYDKSKVLFGLDKARLEIKQQDLAIIVEGQMDVITAHQHGFKNLVASSGTALTSDQVTALKRYTNNFMFALDSDKAGQLAIDRGDHVVSENDYEEIEAKDRFGNLKKYINTTTSYNINRKVVVMPEGKDPDEVIRKNPENWIKAVKEAKSMMQYYFDKVFANLDVGDIDDKKKAVQELLPTIGRLGNKIEQDHWIKKLGQMIDVGEDLLRETLRQSLENRKKTVSPNSNKTIKKEPVRDEKKTREEKMSELFIALLLKFQFLLEYSVNNMEVAYIANEQLKALYKDLVFYYNNRISLSSLQEDKNGSVDYLSFRNWLLDEHKNKNDNASIDQLKILDKLVLLGDKEFYELNNEGAKEEALKMILYIKKSNLQRKKIDIEKAILKAEKELASQVGGEQDESRKKVENLFEELKILSDELNELNG